MKQNVLLFLHSHRKVRDECNTARCNTNTGYGLCTSSITSHFIRPVAIATYMHDQFLKCCFAKCVATYYTSQLTTVVS